MTASVRAGSAAGHLRPAERALLAIVAAGALLAVAPAFPAALTAGPVALLAHVAGLLAGYGVAVLLLLVARLPVLERSVGADRLARWHARAGRTVVAVILVHVVAATTAWLASPGFDPSAATRVVALIGLPWLAAAVAGTAMLVGVATLSIRALRRRVRYEVWHGMHLGGYLAIGLVFAHELGGPDLAGHPLGQIAWSLLYTLVLGALLRYRLLEPVLRAVRHDLRVVAVVPEAGGATSVVVRGRDLGELGALPGQFFRWRFLTRSTWTAAHPVSLSAAPHDRFLRLTVRTVGDGTARIAAIPVGTRVVAEGPYGAITARRSRGRGVLLIAGGVGITAMRALFETIDPGDGELTLIYRARHRGEVLFESELRHMAERRGARLILLLGGRDDPGTAMDEAALTRLVPGLARCDVYLCASEGLAASVRRALLSAGVSPARIHQEVFAF